MPFSSQLYIFLLFHPWLHVQTLPMILHLQMQKHLLFQYFQITYNSNSFVSKKQRDMKIFSHSFLLLIQFF